MKTRALVLISVCLLVAADQPAKDAKMKDEDKLQGTWNFASLEIEGMLLPANAIKGSKIEIKGDGFTTSMPGVISKGTFKVNPTKSPKTIDLHFTDGPEKGNPCLGIYELDDETWKLCLCVGSKVRPKEFVTKAGSGHALETLKRAKP